ncbi:MAG TPA: hypothetical protein VLL52_12305 [Anaerolineae bacterium]|nr:hypothetical protein [Anaerolineae bacterium]
MSYREQQLSRAEARRRARQKAQVSLLSWFVLGLVVGLLGALLYAWVVDPVVYYNASPARLGERSQSEYILLVAQAYVATGDREDAAARLDLLELDDETLVAMVTAQLEQYLRQGRPGGQVQSLVLLGELLGIDTETIALFNPEEPTRPPATATPLPTEAAPATLPPTRTPRPTLTPTPTPMLTPTAVPVYRLLSQEQACNDAPNKRLEVIVLDAFLTPLAGVEVVVRWDGGGIDRFYTGLQPAVGAGYADFDMVGEVAYTVVLAEGSPLVSGLRLSSCPSGALGGWRLTFQRSVLD